MELLSLSKIPNFLQDLALTLATEKVACQKREMMRGRIFGSLSSPLSIPGSFASTLQGRTRFKDDFQDFFTPLAFIPHRPITFEPRFELTIPSHPTFSIHFLTLLTKFFPESRHLLPTFERLRAFLERKMCSFLRVGKGTFPERVPISRDAKFAEPEIVRENLRLISLPTIFYSGL